MPLNTYYPVRMFDVFSDGLTGAAFVGIVACIAWLPPQRTASFELLKVRQVVIGSAHLQGDAAKRQMHWRPGGWIANDARMRNGESTHPKGMQASRPDAQPHPEGGTKIRDELKSWATPADLTTVVVTRERTGDRE